MALHESRSRVAVFLIGGVALLAQVLANPPAQAAGLTFTVTNDLDKDPQGNPNGAVGSLRRAIVDANSNPGDVNTIRFNIDRAKFSIEIVPASPLPAITNPVIIDATTQPGTGFGRAVPVGIVLDGKGQKFDGLTLQANGCVVRGFVIRGFDGAGIRIRGSSNVVAGNLLGNLNGVAYPNDIGVLIDGVAGGNIVGGTNSHDRNVISANTHRGVLISGPHAMANYVIGNYIGVDDSGRHRLGNRGPKFITQGDLVSSGVEICCGASGNFVGAKPEESFFQTGNTIGDNGYGVLITGPSGSNVVQANFIGTNKFADAVGNLIAGVAIEEGASHNVIGGLEWTPNVFYSGNDIARNPMGVFVTGAATLDNSIRFNRIHDNYPGGGYSGLGIDLAHVGVTPNDQFALDADDGPNHLQNFPRLLSAGSVLHDFGGHFVPTSTIVRGRLDSEPNLQYHVDFYGNTKCDPSGFGEGARWVGSTLVATDVRGAASFNAALRFPVDLQTMLTATATKANNVGETSEFSKCVRVVHAEANLSVTMGVVNIERFLAYRMEVMNDGPLPAEAVVLTDVLPDVLGFSSCSSTGGGVCGGTGNTRTVTFESLEPGTSVTVLLEAFVQSLPPEDMSSRSTSGGASEPSNLFGMTVVNTATVQSLTPDPKTRDNIAAATVTIPGRVAVALQQLIAQVEAINLGKPQQHKIAHDLDKALDDLKAGHLANSCKRLSKFVDDVRSRLVARSLTDAEANALLGAVGPIRRALGCA